MEKKKKTRVELIVMIERQLWKHREYESLGCIDVHPHEVGASGINWGADVISREDPSKREWLVVLNTIVPKLQKKFDLQNASQ